ncbi:MAG: PAS domain S-box protein [Polyangiaceae bacterium]|nr:PAS domain S-box protein [Polyangiaceae bacterium]
MDDTETERSVHAPLTPERLQALVHLTHDTIMVRDLCDRIVFWNRGAELRYGWTSQEARGRIIHELLETTFPATLDTIRQQLLAVGHWEGELQHSLRSGERITVSTRWALERDAQGEPCGILEINNDITARKQAEAALQQSEQRLRLAMRAARLLTWNWTRERGALEWEGNQELLAALRDRDGDIARPQALIHRIHPDDREFVQAAVRGSAVEAGYADVEFRLLTEGGKSRWWALHGRAEQNAQGVLTSATGVLRDITERRALQEQLLAAQRLEAVGRLAGGVAHDFNNLLTAILGLTEMAMMADATPTEVSESLGGIENAARRAASLTQQLLGFARKQMIAPRALDLDAELDRAQQLLRRLLPTNVSLTTVSAATWPVRLDPGQYEQMLMNLAINARDAMPQGGHLTIELSNVQVDAQFAARFPEVAVGDYVATVVSDTGSGMDAQVRDHAFEPFFTTKGAGTGLGLATCYGIVKQNRGTIWIDSQPGHGTQVNVYFPRAHEESIVPSEPSKPPESAIPDGLRGRTVLVVDDEEGVRRIAAAALRRAACTVLEASHGEEAVSIAGRYEGPIDLVLSDVTMPGLQLSDLVARLRAERDSLRFLFMSGYSENAIAHQGLLLPGVAFVGKPFTMDRLLNAAAAALREPEHS